MDRYLDTVCSGPTWLKDPRVALVVEQAIDREIRDAHFALHAHVIMPNHVHMLVTPIEKPVAFMRLLKGRSARAANLVLGRTGEPFWQGESYDHWIRDAEDWQRVKVYINDQIKLAAQVVTEQRILFAKV
jgi:type I restriction enzyme R subunit/putative DNA methylase